MLPYKLIDNIKQQDEKTFIKKKKEKKAKSNFFTYLFKTPIFVISLKTFTSNHF